MSLFGGRNKDGTAGSRPPQDAGTARTGSAPTVTVPSIADPAPQAATQKIAMSSPGGQDVTHVGRSVVLKGDLSGDEDLTIEGEVKGRIDLPDHQLTIGAHGRIYAELNAKAVVVVGEVTGNVSASERVEVHDSGIVTGDIRAPRLLIHEGAVVNGAIDMSDPDSEPVPASSPSRKSKDEESDS